LSRENAPHGKILRLPLDTPELAKAKTVVPQSAGVIESFCPSDTGLYVADLVGGPSQIRFFRAGNPDPMLVPLKPVSAVQQMLSPEGDRLLFRNITYISPFVWMTFDSGSSRPTALAGTSPADFSD